MTPPFVTVTALVAELRAARPPVVADVRWALDGSEGHHTYVAGHLPGAVYVDLETDLSGPATVRDGRHPLPSPERFAQALGARGIGDGDRVVAYDVLGGVVAARLVWLLRAIGHDAAVLSGGPAAWPGPLERGEVTRPATVRTPVPWPETRLADADAVAVAATSGEVVVLDAREGPRFRGEHEPVDARPGHVPGARNLPTSTLLSADGRLCDAAAIRVQAEQVGALEASEGVVAYCGSGVTACFDLLALETIGIRGRLFPGSWSAWAADPARPASTGR
ncbi:sulfurtransferase [Nitriliruptor alkaliphilus]|uniref:sulfurtransferase n=1 Tax=Nitriliruptor alkaliphilus TaxID=427918 RepID=UPI0006979FEF|nr:sulfurtransferase [Nitriliruptor alkaliphilus]